VSALNFDGFAIVVVNYGSHALLSENLASMSPHLAGTQFVVVDNWYSEEERRATESLCAVHGWTLVALDTNTGFGTGCNRGAAVALSAGAQELMFLNPDAVIDAPSARVLVDAARAQPMALVAPRILKRNGDVWSAGMDIDLATGDARPWHRRAEFDGAATIEWFTGACFVLSSTLWEASGGFDDDYFLYWEDVDFSARVQAAGGSLILLTDATAHHDVGGTQAASSSASKSEIYYYYNIRNRSLFARKHLTAPQRQLWKASAIRAAWAILLRGGRRQFLRPIQPLRALYRGLRDSDYGV
jgi:GT2 family glycosyltransferase